VATGSVPDAAEDGVVADRTVVFVDLAGFTALTEVHGDREAVDLVDRFVSLAEQALGAGDRLVKSIGDAVMVAAPDPAAGLELLRRLLAGCYATAGFPVPRAGLHHGPVIERGGDLFGATVNLAARVAGQAHGGQVLGTDPVAKVAHQAGVATVDLGTFELKNVGEPVNLHEIDVGSAPAGGAIDPVCRMHVDRKDAAGRLRYCEADWWFCSLGCAAQFAAEPERFAREHEPDR